MSINYRGKKVGYSTPAPATTRRAHEDPWLGCSQSAIVRAAGGCLDTDLIAVWFDTSQGRKPLPVLMHWSNHLGQFTRGGYRWNGWTHTNIDGHVRPLTAAEKKMSPQQWVDAHGRNVKALNALLAHKGRRHNGRDLWDHALTFAQAVPYAISYNTVMTPELKSWEFGLHSTLARHMDGVCKHYDYPLWPMTLVNMRYAREKCAQFRKVGSGSFALIFGRGVRGRVARLARGRTATRAWAVKPSQTW